MTPSSPTPIISVRNLSKSYQIGGPREKYKRLSESVTDALLHPGKWLSSRTSTQETFYALRDVSFDVYSGEVVGIIGRNGAGKSTLLKILSGITYPSAGEIELNGRVGSLLEVGTGFHPELTGRENVYFNGSILGMTRREIDDKFDDIVKFAGIDEFLDTPVKRYSSGMAVRLGFAVAAHLDPEILVVDEVLAVGDAEFQKRCLGKMQEVSEGGRTVLFVSHNLISMQMLCTRGILLNSGKVVATGRISDVISAYMSLGESQKGEVSWEVRDNAPGDERLRIKAVRIVSGGKVTGEVDIDKEFSIECDYWNLQPESRRLVSFHIINSNGITLLTSANLPSACITPDPWVSRPYPKGLFQTSCKIPGLLLNDGRYSISLFINIMGAHDNIIARRDIISFTVVDTGVMRGEYMGEWIGVIRPRLEWSTIHIGDQST